ncbi:GLPGLI family protein [Flavobacterium album]|uniref:GLPGLI family protein n=1 Tax=Flavobacterium album TaxID=2175091 RepID=A0A2S1QX72_9FLAO|nr:GLPGLI family protein [Flavobacterium album]AWH84998.1 GLPGLI family protein [Flavobacterium album]
MKKYLHCLIVLAAFSASAQDFRGTATYESKTSIDFSLSGGEPGSDEENQLPPELEAQLQEQLKKAFEKKYTLSFDKTASLYVEEEQLVPQTNQMVININNYEGGKQYKNLKDKSAITEHEVFGKEFLIMDSLHKYDWKLGSETKKIGIYTCYKATVTIKARPVPETVKAISLTDVPEKDKVITAWYTPEIPVSHGPGGYWGLPGLILEVNNGSTTLLCSKVVLNPKDKIEIKAPKKGTKVSRAEFDKIVEDKIRETQEMDEPAPGSNTTTTRRVIRIGG